MCDPTAAGSASIEKKNLRTYIQLQHECKIVALRAYANHRQLFPQGYMQLSSPDPLDGASGQCASPLKIESMLLQIEFLKSLDHDGTQNFGPGVLQMDGASRCDHQLGNASRNITSQSPPPAPAAAAAPLQGRSLQAKATERTLHIPGPESNPVWADNLNPVWAALLLVH